MEEFLALWTDRQTDRHQYTGGSDKSLFRPTGRVGSFLRVSEKVRRRCPGEVHTLYGGGAPICSALVSWNPAA